MGEGQGRIAGKHAELCIREKLCERVFPPHSDRRLRGDQRNVLLGAEAIIGLFKAEISGGGFAQAVFLIGLSRAQKCADPREKNQIVEWPGHHLLGTSAQSFKAQHGSGAAETAMIGSRAVAGTARNWRTSSTPRKVRKLHIEQDQIGGAATVTALALRAQRPPVEPYSAHWPV